MPAPIAPDDSDVHAGQSTVGRRAVIVGAGRAGLGVLGLALLSGAASACGTSQPPKADELQAQLDLATADADLARVAATAAPPALAAALTQIASERAQHAKALATEIARAAGRPPSSATTPAAPTTTAAGTGAAKPAPSVGDVVNALRRSADSANQLVPALGGYRAGLLGSIAASCTASYTVSLGTGTAA
ncbi:MAG TPA: hypothetical protein VFW21_08195 [Mycobacterium sp.]|nr:hypothetical protein [Mycobacterium sp.]